MGNSSSLQQLPSNNVEDRLTVLPDYMEREEGLSIFGHREYYDVCKANNIGISECKTYLRLKFILAKYMKWTLDDSPKTSSNGMHRVINHQLSGSKYSTVSLLNDYHHLLSTHRDQREDIFNFLKMNCKVHFCSAMMRNYRDRHCADRERQRSKLYFGLESSTELNVLQILDRIHCHFLHSFEMVFDILKHDLPPSDDLKYTDNLKEDGYIGYDPSSI